MSTSTVRQLNRTVDETHQWLRDLARKDPFQNEEQAYSLLRAVLHAVRDQLTVEEASHFAQQMPMLVRGFYYEGWRPALAPNEERTREEFMDHVLSSLGPNPQETTDLDAAVRSVLELLTERLEEGQIRHVRQQLPAEMAELWPA